MILVCGIRSEPPLEMVWRELENLGAPYVLFNQRQFANARFECTITNGAVRGWLQLNGQTIRLEDVEAVYTRLMDHRQLPELKDTPEDAPLRQHCDTLHQALMQWCEIAPGRIVNRIAPMATNFSKPFQAQLILQSGFQVPETLITNDPQEVVAFRERHGRIIYKSISAVRSIVQTFDDEDESRLDFIRWCPTQFQQWIPGRDVRVHTVGEQVFATRATTSATDYRYAYRQVGEGADLEAVQLPSRLEEKCINLARSLGLEFAGIDLMITPDDEVYCLEVNPCPAFSYYEANTGQPIARAVARFLAGMD